MFDFSYLLSFTGVVANLEIWAPSENHTISSLDGPAH